MRDVRRSLHQDEGPSCVTKAISLTNIELKAMGLEPDFELQTIAKDVEVELELNACSTPGQDDQQVNTGVESTRLSNDSESLRTGGDQGGSDSKFDDTVIAPLLLMGTPPSDGGEK